MTLVPQAGPSVFFAMAHLGVVNEEELERVCSEREKREFETSKCSPLKCILARQSWVRRL